MAQINYIRHEINQKGETYASVGKRMGVDHRTVNKYANQDEFKSRKKGKKKRKSPVMDPVKPILDKWIKEDLKKKRKYQRTAKRMFQQLEKFHSFEGSYRAVRGYVQLLNNSSLLQITELPLARHGSDHVITKPNSFTYH